MPSAPSPSFVASAAMAALVAMAIAPAAAQEVQRNVIQVENVRMDYAQVMRVRPVFQTLHATRITWA